MDILTVIIVVVVILVAVVLLVALQSRRKEGMAPVRSALGTAVRRAWSSGLSAASWDVLQEALLAADVGVEATNRIMDGVKSVRPQTVAQAREELASRLRAELTEGDRGLVLEGEPAVLLVVGVNGSGKTTTIAKLARRLQGQGLSVLFGGADTFRAAATDQLKVWGERLGVDVVVGQQGGDPASVAFDAIASARAKGVDVVIIDTAGRLQAKKNLMAELAKIHRVASGHGRVSEVLLVLDATAGQDGIAQVREFTAAVPVTGIVLAKLDGTAKGGIVIPVERNSKVPVKFVGTGEGLDGLVPFQVDIFLSALLEES